MATISFEHAFKVLDGISAIYRSGGGSIEAIDELKPLLSAARSEIFELNESKLALQKRNAELVELLEQYERHKIDPGDYKHAQLPSGAWVVVHASTGAVLDSAGKAVTSVMYFCEACFHGSQRSLLQPESQGKSVRVLKCHRCRSEVEIDLPPKTTFEFF